jgi:hypothetical protein
LSPQPTFPARPDFSRLPWSLWSFGAMVMFLVLPTQQASVTTCGERSPLHLVYYGAAIDLNMMFALSPRSS